MWFGASYIRDFTVSWFLLWFFGTNLGAETISVPIAWQQPWYQAKLNTYKYYTTHTNCFCQFYFNISLYIYNKLFPAGFFTSRNMLKICEPWWCCYYPRWIITRRQSFMALITAIRCTPLHRIGKHFTNNLPNTIQIWWKLHLALTQILTLWSLQFCTWHDSYAVMACAKNCCDLMSSNWINTLRQRQNGRHFPDNNFK